MSGDTTYLSQKIGKNSRLWNFGVSATKKGWGAAPKRRPIDLRIFRVCFYIDVIPKSPM